MRPGEKIPDNGFVIEDPSSAGDSMIAGESIPGENHSKGDVFGAAINQTACFNLKAARVGILLAVNVRRPNAPCPFTPQPESFTCPLMPNGLNLPG